MPSELVGQLLPGCETKPHPLPVAGEEKPAAFTDHDFSLQMCACRKCGISLARVLLNNVVACVPVTQRDGLPDRVLPHAALLRAIRAG